MSMSDPLGDMLTRIRNAQSARQSRCKAPASKLRENVERAMQAVPVMGKDGPTGEFKYDGAVANRALELLGKHIGMFTDKHEHSGPNGAPLGPTIIRLVAPADGDEG